ncbi:MAG: hypothetical protein ACXW0Z_03260 [Gemmatirosa sp.]
MRRFALPLAISITSFTLAASAAHAQLAELHPGARVRLRASDSAIGRLEGTITARSGGVLTVASAAGQRSVPIARIVRAEVSRGKRWDAGARRGVVWGSGLGLAAGVASLAGYEDCADPSRDGCVRDPHSRAHYVVVGLGTGAVLGTLVGAAIGVEQWDRVELPARVALRPTPAGLQVVVSRAF